jgi:Bacterial Ig-like domain
MKARSVIIFVIFVLLLVTGAIVYAWRSTPKLVEASPLDTAQNVAATASIQVQFSRPMVHESVESHLKILPEVSGTTRWNENSIEFTPDQPWPAGQKIQVQLERGAKAKSWLAFSMGDQSWSFIISRAALAYLWPAAGQASIYTVDPETKSARQYTHGMNVLDYSANNTGSILYLSASNPLSGADLYKIDRFKADSRLNNAYQPEKLLDCGKAQCRNPIVSPDGEILAYEYLPATAGEMSYVQVWTLSLSDHFAAQAGQAGHETVQPTWSSNGLLAYYDRTSYEYEVLNIITMERIQLPNQTGQPGVWSPDGVYYLAPEITYQLASNNNETGSSHLYRYHLADQTYEDISGEGALEDVEMTYSPSGDFIAFTRKFLDASHWTPGRQIWIMEPDGSNPHPITNEASYNHYDLCWSLDGSTLAYVRFNQETISDPPELWAIAMDGSNPTQLMVGGYSPVWIP